jgi:hypothetical protein
MRPLCQDQGDSFDTFAGRTVKKAEPDGNVGWSFAGDRNWDCVSVSVKYTCV